MKKLVLIFTALIAGPALAVQMNGNQEFANKSGCFLLYDLNQKKIINEYHPEQCAQRISPESTFKIPLSVMAFDQDLITQETLFKWDKKPRMLPEWNQNQTARSWLNKSVVWVSQELTPKLGMKKITAYLHQFHYGNEDFSGGLDHAWLNSSLKISANEQLEFMRALVTNNLPVSIAAETETKSNMYLETSPHGWKLYGKTGSAATVGWFMGFIQKDNQTYIFVTNFVDPSMPTTQKVGGVEAKNITKNLLTQLNLF